MTTIKNYLTAFLAWTIFWTITAVCIIGLAAASVGIPFVFGLGVWKLIQML